MSLPKDGQETGSQGPTNRSLGLNSFRLGLSCCNECLDKEWIWGCTFLSRIRYPWVGGSRV